jgi:hypothetical protein
MRGRGRRGGVIGIEGYKKGYLVKIRFIIIIIGKMCWEGDPTKGFREILINI